MMELVAKFADPVNFAVVTVLVVLMTTVAVPLAVCPTHTGTAA